MADINIKLSDRVKDGLGVFVNALQNLLAENTGATIAQDALTLTTKLLNSENNTISADEAGKAIAHIIQAGRGLSKSAAANMAMDKLDESERVGISRELRAIARENKLDISWKQNWDMNVKQESTLIAIERQSQAITDLRKFLDNNIVYAHELIPDDDIYAEIPDNIKAKGGLAARPGANVTEFINLTKTAFGNMRPLDGDMHFEKDIRNVVGNDHSNKFVLAIELLDLGVIKDPNMRETEKWIKENNKPDNEESVKEFDKVFFNDSDYRKKINDAMRNGENGFIADPEKVRQYEVPNTGLQSGGAPMPADSKQSARAFEV